MGTRTTSTRRASRGGRSCSRRRRHPRAFRSCRPARRPHRARATRGPALPVTADSLGTGAVPVGVTPKSRARWLRRGVTGHDRRRRVPRRDLDRRHRAPLGRRARGRLPGCRGRHPPRVRTGQRGDRAHQRRYERRPNDLPGGAPRHANRDRLRRPDRPADRASPGDVGVPHRAESDPKGDVDRGMEEARRAGRARGAARDHDRDPRAPPVPNGYFRRGRLPVLGLRLEAGCGRGIDTRPRHRHGTCSVRRLSGRLPVKVPAVPPDDQEPTL